MRWFLCRQILNEEFVLAAVTDIGFHVEVQVIPIMNPLTHTDWLDYESISDLPPYIIALYIRIVTRTAGAKTGIYSCLYEYCLSHSSRYGSWISA
jgi:hypothetical protein